jgi:hypothetical protein
MLEDTLRKFSGNSQRDGRLRESALYDGDSVDVRTGHVRGQSASRWQQCRCRQAYVERTVDGVRQQRRPTLPYSAGKEKHHSS